MVNLKASLNLKDNFTNALKKINSSLRTSAGQMASFDKSSGNFGRGFKKQVQSIVKDSQTAEDAIKKVQTSMYSAFQDSSGRWHDMSGKFTSATNQMKSDSVSLSNEVRRQFEKMSQPTLKNNLVDFFNRISNSARDMASRSVEYIRNGFSKIPTFVQTGVSRIISLFGNLGNRIRGLDLWSSLTRGFTNAFSNIRNTVGQLSNTFQSMGQRITGPIRSAFSSVRSFISSAMSSAGTAIRNTAMEVARFESASAYFGKGFSSQVRTVVRESQTAEQAVRTMQTNLYGVYEDMNGKWRNTTNQFVSVSNNLKAEARALATEVRHQFNLMNQPPKGEGITGWFNRIVQSARNVGNQIRTSISRGMDQVPNIAQKMVSSTVGIIRGLASRIGNIDVFKVLTQGIPNIISMFQNMANRIGQIFSSIGSKMMAPIRMINNGFRSIKNGADNYINQVKQRFDSATRSVVTFSDRLQNAVRTFLVLKGLNFAVNTISSNLSSSFDRVDTLERYPRLLTSMGYTANQAQSSMDKLATGIKGLPTSLDDIVATTQQMVVLTGSVEKATDMSLALNNSFLASGSSSADTQRGMVQFSQMLSRNEVDIISWRTLMETMPYALTEVGKSLGKSSMWELYDAIKDGEMSFEDLGDAFVKLNQDGGKLFEMAKEQSRGFKNSMALIGFAFERGFGEITMGINQRLRELGLPDIPQMLANFAAKIDSVFEWIIPRVSGWVDSFINTFQKLKDGFVLVKDLVSGFFNFDLGNLPIIGGLFQKATEPISSAVDKVRGSVKKWSGNIDGFKESIDNLFTHKVKPGDTLWGIAEKYYGDGSKWRQIYEANKDIISDPWWIFPDQEFTIPGLDSTREKVRGLWNGMRPLPLDEGELIEGEIKTGGLFNNFALPIPLLQSISGLRSIGDSYPGLAKLAMGLLAIKPAASAAKFGLDGLTYLAVKHPLVAVTGAVLGLAGGIGYLYQTNEDFKKGFDNTISTMKKTRVFQQAINSFHNIRSAVGEIDWSEGFVANIPRLANVFSIGVQELVANAHEWSGAITNGLATAISNVDWTSVAGYAYDFVTGLGGVIADKMPLFGQSTGRLAGSIAVAAKDIVNSFANKILGLKPDNPFTTEKLLDAMWTGTGQFASWAAKALSGFGSAFYEALLKELTGFNSPEEIQQDRVNTIRNKPEPKRTLVERAIIQSENKYSQGMNEILPDYNPYGITAQNPTSSEYRNSFTRGQPSNATINTDPVKKQALEFNKAWGDSLEIGNATSLNRSLDLGGYVKYFWDNIWGENRLSQRGTDRSPGGTSRPVPSGSDQNRFIPKTQGTPHSPGPIIQPIDTQPRFNFTKPKGDKLGGIGLPSTMAGIKVDVPVEVRPSRKNTTLDMPEVKMDKVEPVKVEVPVSVSPARSSAKVESPSVGVTRTPTISTEPVVQAQQQVQRTTQVMDNRVSWLGNQMSTNTNTAFGNVRTNANTGMIGMSQSVNTGNTSASSSFRTMGSSVTSTTGSAMSSVGMSATAGMGVFTGAVGIGMNASVGRTRQGTSAMVGTVAGMSGSMYGSGLNAMYGLASGINAGAGAAIAAARRVANSVSSAVRSALRVSSPSKVMEDIGVEVPHGLGGGILEKVDYVRKAVRTLVKPITDISTPDTSLALSTSGGSIGVGSTTVNKSIGNITIHINGAQDAKAVAEEVIEMINDAFDSDLGG